MAERAAAEAKEARRAERRARADSAPAADAPEARANRELSWLEFNGRVLEEGLNADNPLLERLSFLSIVGSNLDEFYQVRVAGLRQLRRAGVEKRDPSGMTPAAQLQEITRRVRLQAQRLYRCLTHELLPALAQRGVVRMMPGALEAREQLRVDRWFKDEVFPALVPLAAEDDAEFPRVNGLSPHLVVRLRREGAKRSEPERLAVVELPRTLPRFFHLPGDSGQRFVLLEDIVRERLETLFPGHEIVESACFRVTRDADLALDDEEVRDLLEAMETILRARRQGAAVRLELEAEASEALAERLCKAFELDRGQDLFRLDGPPDLKPFLRLSGLVDVRALHYPAFRPQPVPAFEEKDSVWDAVREKDVLVHLPYESFAPLVGLLQAAADDPQVLAVKQTLYRTGSGSPIIAALERAALRGKQVAVLVELKARFDEAQNIAWARRLQDAGARVVYGVTGLKTHAKLLMVVRREADGVRRYVHLSTGNYHDQTADKYEDVGLFTCDPAFGEDAANFFNAVTGYSEPQDWRRLVVAPTGLRPRLVQLLRREAERSTREEPGLVMLKMNSLADPDMISELYRTSQAGVKVKLVVRGICCLRPNVPGLSDNVEVRSIVDRFLEHSRIFYFRNGGDEEVFLSSADFMPRNLDRRLEVMFPVRDETNRAALVRLLRTNLEDNQRAWRLKPDGTYERVAPRRHDSARRAQFQFMEEALAGAEASRLRRLSVFRPQGPGTAPGT